MRPIIHNDISGFLITEEMVNRYEEFVPEPGPQPGIEDSFHENKPGRNTVGNWVRHLFGLGVPRRTARVRNRYQRNY